MGGWMIAVFIEIQRHEKNSTTDASVFRWNVRIKHKNKKIKKIISFPTLARRSARGTQVIAQSLKTHQQNGPKLEILQTVINTFGYLFYHYGSYEEKKKSVVTKTTPPVDSYFYLDTMTGTNSSNDRLILRQNVEINSNEYFSYDVFSGVKSSTTWNGNAIAQSPKKFRDISNTYNIRFIMAYRTIIDLILHLFIICYDLWCQLPLKKNPTFRHNGSSVFGKMLQVVSPLPGCKQTSRDRNCDVETTSALYVD